MTTLKTMIADLILLSFGSGVLISWWLRTIISGTDTVIQLVVTVLMLTFVLAMVGCTRIISKRLGDLDGDRDR